MIPILKDALIDPTGTYRYWLARQWDVTQAQICWVMLNPSTADSEHDDATTGSSAGAASAAAVASVVAASASASVASVVVVVVAEAASASAAAAAAASAEAMPSKNSVVARAKLAWDSVCRISASVALDPARQPT